MPGRSILTATSRPSCRRAKCTCATEALATATGSNCGEHLVDRPVVRALERGEHEFGGERRHLVLQLRELVGDVGRQQVAARRQQLAELDEDRAQRFERQAQAHRARRVEPAPEQQTFEQPAQPRTRSWPSMNSSSPKRRLTAMIFSSRKKRIRGL